MKITPLIFKSPYFKTAPDGASGATPVYATVEKPDRLQVSTIKRALDELEDVEYLPNDLLYMHSIGANPPFKNGKEAIEWIKQSKAQILYADFSNPNVHACLDYSEKNGTKILINSNYKDDCSHPDVLAISEAIFHECGHGKDFDNENSIQEELNCLSLNVLAHRFYEKKYNGIFKNSNSFLYSQGVSLYPKLFFDFYKTALKKRVADKYGYLQSGDSKHSATKLAENIKRIYENTISV